MKGNIGSGKDEYLPKRCGRHYQIAMASCLISIAVLLTACDFSDQSEPTVSTSLDIHGEVVSSDDDGGIPNAAVYLGAGGHFSFPVVFDSTTTDEAGQFNLSSEVQHQRDECGYWIGAAAEGFRPSDPAGDVAFITCTSAEQSVEVTLRALNS